MNGNFDPVTRENCKVNDLIPNLALRSVIEDFLNEYKLNLKLLIL